MLFTHLLWTAYSGKHPLTFPAGTGSREFSVRADAGWELPAEVWLALCRLPAAKWGKRLHFCCVSQLLTDLERLHIKNIRNSKLWGINWFLEITEILCFWFFGFWGFFCQEGKGLWQAEIFLYGISPVLIASNPRTTKSGWKMLLEFCQASNWALYPELGVSLHNISNWVWYWQHMQKGWQKWNLTPVLSLKILCCTTLGMGKCMRQVGRGPTSQ